MMAQLSLFRLYTSVIQIGPDTGNAIAEDYPYAEPGGCISCLTAARK